MNIVEISNASLPFYWQIAENCWILELIGHTIIMGNEIFVATGAAKL